jgi:hypothetical protein
LVEPIFLGAHTALARAAHVAVRHGSIRVAHLLHHRPFAWTFRHGVAGGDRLLAMFSLLQAIIAADAGLIASTAVIVEAANRTFILFSP